MRLCDINNTVSNTVIICPLCGNNYSVKSTFVLLTVANPVESTFVCENCYKQFNTDAYQDECNFVTPVRIIYDYRTACFNQVLSPTFFAATGIFRKFYSINYLSKIKEEI